MIKKGLEVFALLFFICLANGLMAQCNANSGFSISSPRCINGNVTFIDTTSGTAPDSVYWRFSNDNAVMSGNTVSRSFNATGSVTVWMYRFFSNPAVCVDTVFDFFTVIQTPASATPAGTSNICIGDSVTLSANAGAGMTYQWLKNGVPIGGATSSTYRTPDPGLYTVEVTQNGCTSTSNTATVAVYNYPNADFTFNNDSACSGTSVDFTNGSTGSSLSYSWSFGDGSTASNLNPTHVYDTVGTHSIVSYTVRLIASTPGNCRDTMIKTIRVRRKPDPSVNDFNNTPPFIQCNVGSFPFSLDIDNITTTSATNTSYTIYWGDSTTQSFGSFTTLNHVYTTTGLFLLKVLAIDNFGCSNINTYQVFNGGNPAVSVGNTGSTSGCRPYAITLTIDTSHVSGVGNNAPGSTYTLTFNDGSAPVVFTHPPPPSYVKTFLIPSCGVNTPSFPNAFQAELAVTNPCGTNSATVKPIYVSAKPEAQIGIIPDADTVCEDDIFTIFDDSDTGSVSSNSGCNQTPRRLWNVSPATGWNLVTGYFGNASNFNNNPANWGSQSFQIEFTDTGVWDVRLVVGNIAQAGVSVCGDDTIIRRIRVFRRPVAAFTLNMSPNSGCVNTTVTPNNTSTGQELTYLWSVTPNTGYTLLSGSLTSQSPQFGFNTAGQYIIQLIAANRCYQDTVADTIIIRDVPVVSLTGPQQYCGPRTVFFDTGVANTTHRPVYNNMFGDTLEYAWTVTGGAYSFVGGDSTSPNPSINLLDAGTYTVTVTFTNECGYDTATQVITIHPLPVADYNVNDTDQCINGNSFAFTNTSTVSSGTITTNSWNFGQNPTSSAVNPTKTYTTTGTFNVRLIVVTNQGCRDTIIKQVRVYPKPTPNFTINDTDQCINGNNFIFTNTSSIAGGGTNTYLWTFTNRPNDTSTATSPTKVYDTVGNFSVKLVVTSNNGCRDSITRTLRVYPKPNPAFTVNDTDQCVNGNSFVFTNGTTISSGTLAYTWKFSTTTSDTSALTNPTKVYTTPNTYNVKLVARSGFGCRDSVTQPLYVRPKPTVTYNVNDSDQCLTGNSFVFANTSSIASGTASYLWSFSNTPNDTSTQTNPTKVYASAGVFPVKLVGTSDFGCKDSATKNMTVFAEPIAGFSVNDTDQCLNGNNFIFTDTSISGAYSRLWRFGDGTTSTAANPSKTYSAEGTYTVRLIVTITAGGCIDSTEATVHVQPRPVPAFTINDSIQCFPGHQFVFTNGSTINAGTITYLWKFNAPSATDTSTQTNPSKIYGAAGTYIVRLIATSNINCIDSVQHTVIARPDIVDNNIGPSQGICSGFAPDTIKQTGAAISGGTGTFTYQWQQSNDSVSWSNIGGATTAFYKPPVLTDTMWYRRIAVSESCDDTSAPVKMTVTPAVNNNTVAADQEICAGFAPAGFTGTTPTGGIGTFTYQWQESTDSATWNDIGSATSDTYQAGVLTQTTFYRRRVISGTCNAPSDGLRVLVNPKPAAAFTTASVCFGFNANFSSTSTLSSGSITQYDWTFGDGNTGTGATTSNSYASTGPYTIKLIVTSDEGCKDSTTRNINVHPKPVASFTNTDTCFSFANSFNATGSSAASGSITSYAWNFGDASTGTGATTTRTYATANTFNVKLIVTTDSNCRDSVTHSAVVYPKPVAAYTTNDTDQCVNGNNFVFTNASSIASGTLTYLWNRGENATDTSTSTSTTKIYAANGNYNVGLRAVSNFGCTDTITKVMTVFAKPTPAFNINDTDQCLNGNNFVFTNTSSVSPVVGLTYVWNFGNSTTSATISPNNVYGTEGTYPVKLVVTSANNCKDSITKTVYVYPKPTPAFTINDSLQCFGGNSFAFTNGSTVSSGSNTYLWKFNAPSQTDTSTQTSPVKNYASSGTFTVRLIATSDKTCKDSIQKPVTVNPDIINNTVSAPQSICSGAQPDTLRQQGSAVSGGNSAFTYQWQQSTDSASWTNIGSTNTVTYLPPTLFTTTWFRRVIVSGPCSDTSAPVKVTVTPGIGNNIIAANQTICAGFVPSKFTGTVPTGGSGIYTYQWQISPDSTNWANMGGATDTNYQETVLNNTRFYRRLATSGSCTVISNVIKVTVNPKPVAAFNTASVCFGFTTSFTSTSTVSAGSITQYDWNFGDAGTGSGASPTHAYAAAGTYTIKLIVTSGAGCIDSTTRTTRVHPKPVAAYVNNDTCFGFVNSFNAATSTVASGNITAYDWNFGDATTASGVSANKTYAAAGAYNTKLIVTTDSSCQDSITKTVNVHPRPTPAYTVNDSDQCVNGNNFVFTNGSSVASGSLTYLWRFSATANDTSTATNPNKVYAANGNNNVRLIATSNFGCKDSITKVMTVYAKPTPAFNINDTDQCINGNSFTFTNGSSINPIVGLSYVWTYGNGNGTTTTNASQVYSAPGTFPVKLVVTSVNDCKDSITKNVHVYPKPTPNFTINDSLQCFGPNTYTFTNTSTVSSGSNTYFWRLNLLAATDTSTQTNPTKVYSTDGTFTIRLTATSDRQCKDSVEKQVTVKPDIVNNAISTPQFICQGTTPDTLRQTSGVVSGGDAVFTYQWQHSTDSVSWSNIGSATGISFAPPALGVTTWYRRIITSGPCEDTSNIIKILVTPSIGNNTITANQTICEGLAPARFNGALPTGGNGIYAYQWQHSTDSVSWGNIALATDTNYQAPALTQATFYRRSVTSGSCAVISAPIKVNVNPKPAASFNTASVCFGFDANFSSTSSVPAGSITQNDWNFGDATTGTGASTTHNYAAAGAYTAKLVITTAVGCKDSTTRTLRIHPKPVAAYVHNDTCFSFLTSFNASTSTVASGNITAYNWNLGDASTATGVTTNRTYAAVGTYNVKLIVTTDSSCRDSITKAVFVRPNPVAAYTVNDSDQCLNGNNFVFTNGSTISAGSNTYKWNFGESAADTSILTNPNKTYAANGNFNVKLIATSGFGCRDSITKPMTVYAKPAQAFSVNDTDQCFNGQNFLFTNNSNITPAVGLTYLWTFGNGDTSTQTNPTKVYAAPGTYPVKLRVTSIHSCVDSVTKNMYVYPKPNPGFNINDTLQCFGPNSFTYTNTSTISSGTQTYFWRFNLLSANDTSSVTSPTKVYNTFGTFTVRLINTSDKGCKDSIQKQVTVKPGIVDNDIATNQFLCQNVAPDTIRQASGSVSGGSGTFSYQWQQSTDSATWTNIGSATSANYTPSVLATTTWYRRIVTSLNCEDTSNVVGIYITPLVGNNTITANQSICEGFAPAKLNGALPTGGNGVFAYQWQHSGDSISWSNIGSGGTDTSYQPVSLTQTRYFRRSVTSGSCTVISPPVRITVNPKPAASFTTASVCLGVDATFTSTSLVSSGSITSYNWRFGDGNTATGSATTHGYAAFGTYTTQLIVTTNNGCVDSTTRVLRTHPNPVAAYTYNDTCHTKTHSFNAIGSTVALGSIASYNWDFGDVSSATGSTAAKTYALAGNYNVRLIVTSDSACRDTIIQNVTVHPNPLTAFTVNDSDQCVNGNSFVFTNTSSILSGSIVGYRWNLGENAVDTTTNTHPATKVYAANGNYNVRLVATSNLGCRDSITKPVIVYAKPAQAFNINDTDQCINGNNFVFTNASNISPAVGLFYSWTFGNGDTSTQTSPSKVYTAPGTYPVKLRVTSVHNCKDSVTKTVYVYPKPTPDFSIDDTLQCFGPNTFTFTNASTISSGSNTYFWRFNVLAANDTSTQTSPSKVYGAAGTYTIRLTATSDRQCKDSIEKTVTVRPDIVNNTISAPQFLCEGATPDTLRQTSGVVSGGTSAFTYQWQHSTDSVSWSNIASATGINYAPPALSVTTWYRRRVISGPCEDTSATVKISVTPGITNNTVTANQSICEQFAPARFNGALPTGGNGVFAYQWQNSIDSTNWNNIGSATDTNYQAPVLTQTTHYRRRVTSGSCTVISPPVRVIVNPKPVASFNTASVCFGFDANFTSTSSVSAGSIAQHDWNFGDATTGTGSPATHNYAAAGTYTAKLIITTAVGCKDSTTRTLRIHPKPVAAYANNDTCFSFLNSFNAASSTVASGTITAYNWNMGDASTAAGVTTTRTYAAVGTYNVKLVVTSDSACKDSITKPVTVHPNPVAAYTVNDSDQCVNGNNFVFTNGSSISSGSSTYRWNFGSAANDTTSQVHPSKVYAANGVFNTKLIATSNFGCSDSVTKPMTVYAKPAQAFNINDTDQCVNGNNFVFTNASTVNPVVGLSYVWTFGNGNGSTGTSPTQVYAAPGTYPVKLVVTSINGCKDSITRNVYVYPKPSPDFTINDTLQCFGPNSFTFTNGSSISTGSLTYFWKFNTLSATDTSSQVNPNKNYAAAGVYTVRLTATSDRLCKDSIEKQVTVRPNIVNNVVSAPQFICQGSTPATITQNGGAVSGGSGTYTYQWQQSTDSASWANIGGATGLNYNPPSLTVTTWYRRIVVSSPCADTSAPIKIHVTPAITNNVITSPQVICYGQTPAPLTSTAPGGGLGTYTYLWQQSADTFTWNNALSVNNNQNYSPGTLLDTVYYRRRIISGACTTTSNTLKIAVKPLPVVAFNNTTECYPNITVFTDNSTVNQGNNTNWQWTFGDNTSSTQQSPQHQYVAGTYTTKLIVTTNFGCKDSLSKSITVHPKPVAGYSTTDICNGFASTFTDTAKVSTGSVTTWEWAFDDGFGSSAKNPVHTYNTHGTYNVRQIVTTDRGCKDTIVKPLVIFPKPVAKFSASTQCFPDSTVYRDSSTVALGNITNWGWTFGDGNGSTIQHPKHQYAGDGNYITKLIITTDRGCRDSANNPAVVHPLPVAGFNADTMDCINRDVFFVNTSTGAFFYHWDYSDGDTTNGTVGRNIFNNPGIYNVSLISTTVFGCRDTVIKPIRIIAPPAPAYTILPDSGCAPLQVNYINTSLGEYTTYEWIFGNGNTSTQYSPPQQTYVQSLTADTSYRVTLRATNLCGLRTVIDTVKVYPRPVANFGPDANLGCTPKTFTFTNTSSGYPEDYIWDFGNGNTSTDQNPPPQLYTTDSTIKVFTIRLRVINRCGTDTVSRQVRVLPKNAKSLFGVDTLIGCAPLTVNITDFSSGATIVNYEFGDGNTSNNPNPQHTFTTAGTYRIRQFIANTCTNDTSERFITVLPAPAVSFTLTPSEQCKGQDIQFVSNSPDAVGFKWEFGNGDTSILNNPKYKYPNPGTYTVRLSVVSGTNACRNSVTDTLNVRPLPTPVMQADTTLGCPPLTVNFTDATTGTAFITWNFGDGNSTSVINPTHTYTNTGTYLARMIVRALNGCVDSVDRLVTVHPEPVAAFATNSTFCDAPVAVNYTNTSTGATTYFWDFGNTLNSTNTNPSVLFNGFGNFTTVLRATNQFGCQDTASQTFEIYRRPTVSFTLDTNQGCPPLRVRFTNNSQQGTRFIWDFGDGDTSSTQNPEHLYVNSGLFNVKLKAVSGGTCADSVTLTNSVNVYPQPIANFNVSFTSNPAGYGTADFINLSLNADKFTWDFGDGTNESVVPGPSHRYSMVGNYLVSLIVATNLGCRDTMEKPLEIPFFSGLFVPNAFTPNSGINEVREFKPVGISLKSYRIQVYNAWGQLLWESTELVDSKPAVGWDGTHNGKPCQQDAYVWKIDAEFLDGSAWPGQKARDGRYHREGTVTLIR